jgi:SAM-dependent methyltransferase
MTTKLEEARSALAAEWASRNPTTPEEIHAFYVNAHGIRADLEAWHETRPRQLMTLVLATVAQQIKAKSVVDIGAGTGADLQALRKTGLTDLCGVEPNSALRLAIEADGIRCHDAVAAAPIEDADLITCLDVLEHVPDPDTFLAEIARRARSGGAKPGAVLIETTSTYDTGTPLHLRANRAWHPGRVLERHGWQLINSIGSIRVWQRANAARTGAATAIILCAYRTVTIPTFLAIQTLANRPKGWRVITKTGDALVSRARSVAASRWLQETDDDVFLMVDDDITFQPEVAEQVVRLARERDIACAGYPVRSGQHLALRGLEGPNIDIGFGPAEQPLEIQYAATGFLAVHRRVLEQLAKTLTLCHEDQPWAFYPFFLPMLVEIDGVMVYLSEDWAFSERARAAGFKVWLDPAARIGHLATVELNVANMAAVAKAVAEGFDN